MMIVVLGSWWQAVLPRIGSKKLLKPIVSAIAHKKMAHPSPFSMISLFKRKTSEAGDFTNLIN